MNPMTNMKNVLKLSEQELRSTSKSSWHDQYRHSAWVFVGGLPYDLTEGDIICVFSQYGEVVNINLVRDKGTGKSKGFCFVCYEDQRSTNLAVDNFNGVKLLNRTIRVDHCEDYKAPKDDKMDEETRQLHAEGCAPGSKFGKAAQLPSSSGSNGGLDKGLDLPSTEKLLKPVTEQENSPKVLKEKKRKREAKEKNNKEEVKKLFKRKEKQSSTSSCSDESTSDTEKRRKRKSQKKVQQKEARDLSSSSEESGRDNRRKVKKMSKKYSSSDEESKSSKNEKRDKKDYDKHRAFDARESTKSSLSGKYCTTSRDFSKESYGSQRSFHKSDKSREDYSLKILNKDRSLKNRENSRRYETATNAYDDRRQDRVQSEKTQNRYH